MSEFDKKISALSSGSLSAATDEYVIARGGGNLKISGADVAAAATKVGTLAELAVTGAVTLGSDVVVSRGAANRLDLASGDSLNLVSGSLKIAGTDVLSATTLGSGVTASSLTSVGTLTALTVTGNVTLGDSSGDLLKISGQTLIGHTASVGANPNVLQIKSAGAFGGSLGIVSGNNEVAGSLRLASSSTNSIVLQVDPDNLRNSSDFSVSVDGTERARITAGGELLTGGKTTATANGGDVQVSSGITFPATQVAKSDVNTLDDYEEGTWTPSFAGETNCSSVTLTSCWYVKVGGLVTYSMVGTLTVTTTATKTSFTFTVPFAQSTLTDPQGGSAMLEGPNPFPFAAGNIVDSSTGNSRAFVGYGAPAVNFTGASTFYLTGSFKAS